MQKHGLKVKGNSKLYPITGHEGQEKDEEYICALSLTSVLDEVGVNATLRPLCHTGKRPVYSFYGRLGGPQTRSARVRKIWSPTGIRSPARPAPSENMCP